MCAIFSVNKKRDKIKKTKQVLFISVTNNCIHIKKLLLVITDNMNSILNKRIPNE